MRFHSNTISFFIPDFVEVQKKSFSAFLQEGLIEELSNRKQIRDVTKGLGLLFYPEYYQLDFPRHTPTQAVLLGKTYSSRLYVPVCFFNGRSKERKIKWALIGRLPLMTKRGHFIINGSPRVIINQLIRSPGIYYNQALDSKGCPIYWGDLIPERGAWLRFKMDREGDLWLRLKKTKKIPITSLFQAVGVYKEDILNQTEGLDEEDVDGFLEALSKSSLKDAETTQMLLALCDFKSEETACTPLYEAAFPKVAKSLTDKQKRERGKRFLFRKFQNPKTYSLSRVGRDRLNNSLRISVNENQLTLTKQDLINAVRCLLKFRENEILIDDIDNLKNRRVRTSGELLRNQFNVGLDRLEGFVKDKMQDCKKRVNVRKLITSKKVNGSLREFFGSNPLSQYMDQTNPLAEITHKRRISLLGPGGVKRENAMKVRSIHPTYYGRICPIETPEGQNAGLVNSLTICSDINPQGFLQTPFHKIYQGQVQQRLGGSFFSAKQEESVNIAPGDLQSSVLGFLDRQRVPIKFDEDYKKTTSDRAEYAAVTPLQMISVATSLIPFLEHNDANRALMGSNMQRQAVPVISPELPTVGTGLEGRVVANSGHLLQSKTSGFVLYASSEKIRVQPFLSPLFGKGSGKTRRPLWTKQGREGRETLCVVPKETSNTNTLSFFERKRFVPSFVQSKATVNTFLVRSSFTQATKLLVAPHTKKNTLGAKQHKHFPYRCPFLWKGKKGDNEQKGYNGLLQRERNKTSLGRFGPYFHTKGETSFNTFQPLGTERKDGGSLSLTKQMVAVRRENNKGKPFKISSREQGSTSRCQDSPNPPKGWRDDGKVFLLPRSQGGQDSQQTVERVFPESKDDHFAQKAPVFFRKTGWSAHVNVDPKKRPRGGAGLEGGFQIVRPTCPQDSHIALQPIPRSYPLHQHNNPTNLARKTCVKDRWGKEKESVGSSMGQHLLHKDQPLNQSALHHLCPLSFERVGKRIRKGTAALLVSTLHHSALRKGKKGVGVGGCLQGKEDDQHLVLSARVPGAETGVVSFPKGVLGSKPQRSLSLQANPLYQNRLQKGWLAFGPRTGLGGPFHSISLGEGFLKGSESGFSGEKTLSTQGEKTNNFPPRNALIEQNPPFFFSRHSLFLQKETTPWLKPKEHRLQRYERSNQKTCLSQKPGVREGEWVQKGDLLANSSSSASGELALGKNVLVAYMPWEGYNFEDAILISERLVYDDVFTSIHIQRYRFELAKVDVNYAKSLREHVIQRNQLPPWFVGITHPFPGGRGQTERFSFKTQHLNDQGVAKTGSWVQEGDVLVARSTPMRKKPLLPHQKLLYDVLQKPLPTRRDTSFRVPQNVEGRVLKTKIFLLEKRAPGFAVPDSVTVHVHIYLAEKRKIQVGDKMSGRHGNKGIVSRILPRQDMPFLPNGTPIDVVLNPLGVPSRMNVGQVFESLLGLAGTNLNQQFKISPFDELYGSEASRTLVYSKLYQARLKTGQDWLFDPENPGKTLLFDGRTGQCFDQSVTVGQAYMLKLIHLVVDKVHARSTGRYSLITQQPVRGKSKHGGQRVGEMEVWALEGFGVAYTLDELLTIKSDDVKGREQIVDFILKKEPIRFGRPASFRVLIRELQSLCLRTNIYQLREPKR